MAAGGRLAGRRALVTGGGRGIGRAVALALAREGAAVAVAARTLEQTRQVAAEIMAEGGRAAALQADVSDPKGAAGVVERAAREMGGLEILVNGAGGAETGLLSATDEAMWQRVLALNLTSVYACTRAAVPAMRAAGWGRVINIASRAGLTGYSYVSAYVAAKHGVVGFTRAIAMELAGTGVTVNAICPGQADTEMTRQAAERIASKSGRTVDETLAKLAALNPSGVLIAPEAVAGAAVVLALPEAAAITGQAVAI